MSDATENASEAAPAEEGNSRVAKPTRPDMFWYVVHAYSGMEKAV